jgi:hypothetical protein
MAPKQDKLVKIGVAGDEIEAGVWRDALEREGVAVYVKSADAMSSFGVAPIPGSLEVYVRAQDEKRARWILGDILSTG